jgi:hypothetical protein
MAKDASERYQSAAEMRNDLVVVAAREDSGRRPTLPPETVAPTLNRRSLRLVVATLAVSVSIVILALEQPRRLSISPQAAPAPQASSSASQAEAAASAGKAVAVPEPIHAPAVTFQERPVAVLPALAPRPNLRPKPKAPAPTLVSTATTAPVAPAAPPPADASVTLGVTPWGEIIVDGSSHGVSPPLTHLTLAPGIHTIEIRNGAAPPLISRLDLQPGQAVEVKHRF